MDRKAAQLIFPLLAVLVWPAGFIMFGDLGVGQADQLEVAMPSLRTTVDLTDTEPERVRMLKIRGLPDSPYLKMAVASAYDGRTWDLQDAADLNVFDELDLSRDSGIAAGKILYSSGPGADEGILRNAAAAADPAHLDLPENTSQRVKDLALRITQGLFSPFDKAVAIETFLETRYVYDRDSDPAPDAYEPNDWFLFEAQQGVCSHFNSAFVMLARAAGIPARLVVGYYIEPDLPAQTVYSDQGHAWAEINLEGQGWIIFDATPAVYKDSI